MKKTLTLTVGIPAYNEGANLGQLLADLTHQELSSIKLVKVIVSSDGSSDNTVALARKAKARRLQIFANRNRAGLARGVNQIIANSKSDILVILNADIRIPDRRFIEKLTGPIWRQRADLTTPALKEIEPSNLFESVLAVGTSTKRMIFGDLNGGDNIYTCQGAARAFSRRLYQELNFKSSVSEDAYSYLFCRYHGYKYAHVTATEALFKLPNNFSEHRGQSIRFFGSRNQFDSEFGKEFVKDKFRYPITSTIKPVLLTVVGNPILAALYGLVVLVTKTYSILEKPEEKWKMTVSSKTLPVIL